MGVPARAFVSWLSVLPSASDHAAPNREYAGLGCPLHMIYVAQSLVLPVFLLSLLVFYYVRDSLLFFFYVHIIYYTLERCFLGRPLVKDLPAQGILLVG